MRKANNVKKALSNTRRSLNKMKYEIASELSDTSSSNKKSSKRKTRTKTKSKK